MEGFNHNPVLLNESLDALNIKDDGCYVDGTFGRGGHSAAIRERLSAGGHLYAIDQDEDAIASVKQNPIFETQFTLVKTNFGDLASFAEANDIVGKIDGLLIDLGVSSPQLDDAQRGFSFMKDGPLDMRMSKDNKQDATQWLAEASEREIAQVLWQYGEEKFSRQIAKAIVEKRKEEAVDTTFKLVDIIKEAMPFIDRNKHPATRSFQAIRIFINRELDVLKDCLEQSMDVLAVGGRLAVISFHSLEDRIVKRFMKNAAKQDNLPKGLPVTEAQRGTAKLKIIGKAIKAGKTELSENTRSRSAVLRVAEVMRWREVLGW